MHTTDHKELQFNPPVIGHRGACGYAPENTMASFVKAAQMGVKWIEFDCMLTATGEVVIIHDKEVDRTTSGYGLVRKLPLGKLLSLDAGAWFGPQFSGEKIPTLVQVLEFLHDNDLSANIELKPQRGLEEKLVNCVLDEINRSDFFSCASERLLFSSFSLSTLRLLRKASLECHIGLLMHKWIVKWQALSNELNCAAIHVNHKILKKNTCAAIKKTQKKLLAYTVNDPKRARELFSFGVDAVFSDYPDVIAHVSDAV